MTAISSHIPLVNRKHELEELKNHLNNAAQGQGNLLFIAGEAGVGKTRLVDELKTYAQSQGIQILQGWSLYESLTPYMPFVEALRSANLDHLFSREEPPKVECVYLITDTGLLIKDVVREETKLDSTIFAGMLTAVGEFVKDSLSMLSGEEKKEALNSLGYENYRILIESGLNANLVVILTGRENEFLINDMKEVLYNVEQHYGNILKSWDGDDKPLNGIDDFLKPLITSGKYDGINYAKDDPQIKRNLLFENISLGIERHTKVIPSILCIEDLQWADPSSLALMHYVARNTRKCNLLILGTYRPEDITATNEDKLHPLIKTMQMMSREDLYHKIDLNRLEESYMDEMLTSLLGKTDFTDEFKKQLYKETEGNPFFIVSLIRMLIEERTIGKRENIWILTKDLKEANIPSKVYDVIVRRLYRMKGDEREILEYASVVGEEFTSDILAQASRFNKIELLKQLRNLEQNHKVIRSIESKYKFDHAKIKEVLYSQIPLELRKEYHSLIADTFEKLNKDNLDEVTGDLAFHYYHSGNKKMALPYLIKAGERAMHDYSNEEAIRFYNQALEFEHAKQETLKIFEDLGDIYFLIGEYKKSIESFEKALELAKEKHKRAEITGKLGRMYDKIGKYNESIRISNNGLDLVRGEECMEEELNLCNIGLAHMRGGNYDKGLDALEKSLEIGQKINDQKGIARTLNSIGAVYHSRGEYDRAIDYYKKSLEIRKKINDMRGIVVSTFNIGLSYERQGDFDRSLEHFEKATNIAKKIGDLGDITYHKWGLAEVYYRKGDMKKALDFNKKAIDLSMVIGYKEVIAKSYRMFGMIYGKQKKWEKSIINFEQSFKVFKEMGMKMELGENLFEFGLMWKAKGDIEKAKEHFLRALDIYEKLKLEKHVERVRKEL